MCGAVPGQNADYRPWPHSPPRRPPVRMLPPIPCSNSSWAIPLTEIGKPAVELAARGRVTPPDSFLVELVEPLDAALAHAQLDGIERDFGRRALVVDLV